MRVQSSRLVFLTRYRTKFREFLGEAFIDPSPAYGGTASLFSSVLSGSGHGRVRLAGLGSVPSGVKVFIYSAARLPARGPHLNE